MKTRRIVLTLLAAVLILTLGISPVGAASPQAPLGTFNYTVQLGDSLASISRKFGVSADRILDTNNLRTRPDLIFVGETLIIPTDIGTTPSYVNPFFYTVQTGDTVQTLANKFYIDKFTVRLVNTLPANANVLTAGTTLLIPAGPHRYVVQRNDSIQGIAAMFGTTVNTLLKYNPHLGGGTALFPGQNVFIPIVYNAPFQPIPGAVPSGSAPVGTGEGTGGGGEGTGSGLDPALGLRPTDSSELAKAANASVISAFQTISMPQNVVNLGQQLQIRWLQLRRVRRDTTRDNGAIMTIAVQFRGGNGTVSVQHYETRDGIISVKGLPVIGIYVNAGEKELWNDIEVDIPATCESVTTDQLIITSGIRLESYVEFKVECPAK